VNTAAQIGTAFAYVGGIGLVLWGIYRSVRRRRLDALLLVCISAIAISWIESPYDWAMYAQFPPAMPRMPSWWPLNMTWGGLPLAVPPGYVAYFVLPTLIAAYAGRRLAARFSWPRPYTLLATGLTTGFMWALAFNAILGAQLGVFYYGRVIGGLAIFEGTKHQYPLYDALAMGILVMVFAYLLGRTDDDGRTVVEQWSVARTSSTTKAAVLSVVLFVAIGHAVYGAVFAPHLVTKLAGLVDVGPTGQLYEGVPNQPK
jgi:hypothetical protein